MRFKEDGMRYEVGGSRFRNSVSSRRRPGSPGQCSEGGDPGLRRDDIASRVTRHASRITLALALMLAGCDYIQAPFMEKTDDGGQTTDEVQRVLVIDFTGHTCKSCPKAHHTLGQLKDLYGDRVVPVAFHLGYFAKTQSGDKFTTDFRTPEGGLLEKYFEFVSFPIGTVQNIRTDGLIPHGTWPSAVGALMSEKAPIKIGVKTEYLAGLHGLTADVDITALEAVAGTLKVAVWVVENSITDWQKDEDFDPMDIPDYVHNHVFRTSMNGLWGETIGSAANLEKGFTFTKEFSVALKTGWKAGNCQVVVVVYREEGMEVVQVAGYRLPVAG